MKPLLLGPADGEVITDRVARTLIVKGDCDEMTVAWLRYEAGETGPSPHVHREHADCFYVLDGRVEFQLGADRPVTAEPGTFVVVPPNVVHSFRNDGPDTARFLSIHAPSCGFADYLRALRDGRRKLAERFDQRDPPPDGGRPSSEAVVDRGAARSHEVTLAETAIGSERREADRVTGYWVLDGTLTVGLEDETFMAGVGGFVLVPKGSAHTLEGPARVVTVTA